MNKETIEALQKNEKPFGLMSAELQEAMRTAGKSEVQYFDEASVWSFTGSDNPWHGDITYRLRPDYEYKTVKHLDYGYVGPDKQFLKIAILDEGEMRFSGSGSLGFKDCGGELQPDDVVGNINDILEAIAKKK